MQATHQDIHSIDTLRYELKEYYSLHSYHTLHGVDFRHPILDKLDQYASGHPSASPMALKAAQYEIIAENYQPVIFRHCPFYFEMGLQDSGLEGMNTLGMGSWLFQRNARMFRNVDPEEYARYTAAQELGLHQAAGPYVDSNHHCFPFTNVLQNGLRGLYSQVVAQLFHCKNYKEGEFIESAMRSLLAIHKISKRFAAAAREDLHLANSEPQRTYLSRIAKTADEVPWRHPETFYEALCTLWFLQEVCTSIEGVGMSVIGHLDRLTGEFYRRDLQAGRIQESEAYDLLCRFLLCCDSKYAVNPSPKHSNPPVVGPAIVLGGCDENGSEIFNDVTKMILDAHRQLRLQYPQIHCRIHRNTSWAFLEAANRRFLTHGNAITFLNDDGIVPAQIRAGKSLEDARRYVAGNSWAITLEGYEHSAGGNCGFNLAKIVDLSIHASASTGDVTNKLDDAESFEDVYLTVMGNLTRAIQQMCTAIAQCGCVWPSVNPAPFFSACLQDCLVQHKDYTAGGGRYNPHNLPLTGFATLVDSLLAIRELCYQSRRCSLAELLQAVRANWEGFQKLRDEALQAPYWSDDSLPSNQLADRVLNDLYEATRNWPNERGGPFQLGLYTSHDTHEWAKVTLATPDGRRKGDPLSQGVSPSRLRRSAGVTAAINSCSKIDLSTCPANSVLTISLPMGMVNSDILSSLVRTFAASGVGMLQLNCMDSETHTET